MVIARCGEDAVEEDGTEHECAAIKASRSAALVASRSLLCTVSDAIVARAADNWARSSSSAVSHIRVNKTR